jgi:hypothetical protein
MKEIYLTEEGKMAIEAKIAELEAKRDGAAEDNDVVYANSCIGQIFAYYEILSSATILPVEESWENIESKLDSNVYRPTLKGNLPLRIHKYPNGVIIQKKKKVKNYY